MKLQLERKTQSVLANELNVTQSFLSLFLRGRMGTSLEVAERFAGVLDWTLDEVLAGRQQGGPDPFPNRGRAADIARALGPEEVRPEAIEVVESIPRRGPDLQVKQWLAAIRYWDEHLRLGHPVPLTWERIRR